MLWVQVLLMLTQKKQHIHAYPTYKNYHYKCDWCLEICYGLGLDVAISRYLPSLIWMGAYKLTTIMVDSSSRFAMYCLFGGSLVLVDLPLES